MPYIGNTAGNRFVASQAATRLSGNGSATAFTLEHAVGSDEDILVSVDGVIQEPSTAYAVSNGTTLTFTAAPSNGTNNIFVCYLFRTVATVDHPSTSSLQATDGTFSSTLDVTGAVTANAGVNIDNITIDGTEIDLSSGDLSIDVAGNVQISADDNGEVRFLDGSTQYATIKKDGNNAVFQSIVADGDFVIQGVDGSSFINAVYVDMSENGQVTFGGTTTGGDQVKINNKGSGFILNLNNDSQSNGCLITAQSGTGTVIHHQINNSNGLVGKIESSGSSTTYATSSDYRLKENVSYNFDATTRLKQLKPARFNFIADETNTPVDGFLAHEVSSIVPEAITGEKDAVDANGDIDPQGIDQSKLVPLLVKSLQEALAEIDTLKTKVAALESK
jgi:hypothetical protein